MTTYRAAWRPTKRDKRAWVLLMDAAPRALTIGRYPSKAEALDAAHRIARPQDHIDERNGA
jgi:hypothetical protein